MSKIARERSYSEPCPRIYSGNFTRDKLRWTDLAYEQGKDRLAHWIGAWGHEEVCTLLQHLVARCPYHQMEYLWTVMESVPHRDFLYAATFSSENVKEQQRQQQLQLQRTCPVLEQGPFRPLSTPVTRAVTRRLSKSRRAKNQHLHRAQSVIIHESQSSQKPLLSDLHLFESPVAQSESQLLLQRPFTPSKLPGLGFSSPYPFSKSPASAAIPHSHMCLNLNGSPVSPGPLAQEGDRSTPSSNSRATPFVSSRILTPMRRHMSQLSMSVSPARDTPTRRWATAARAAGSPNRDRFRPASASPASGGGRQKGTSVTPSGSQATTVTEWRTTGLFRPGTGMDSKSSLGLDSRPSTALELLRPNTGMDSRSNTGMDMRPATGMDSRLSTGIEIRANTGMSYLSDMSPMVPLSLDVLEILIWFSDLNTDWQQQELMQMVVCNLDDKELYYLSALLANRRYRDFVTELPEELANTLLSFIPAKIILSTCCCVSKGWNGRCSSESLWKIKARQTTLGLATNDFPSWKQLYLNDLRLKVNWIKGRCALRLLKGHTKKVVSVRLRDQLLASGSADGTARVWDVNTGECLSVLRGHSGTVWTVRFYGQDLLITGAADGKIKIWNCRTGVCERTLSGHSPSQVWAIQQKKDLLVSGGQDKLVREHLQREINQ